MSSLIDLFFIKLRLKSLGLKRKTMINKEKKDLYSFFVGFFSVSILLIYSACNHSGDEQNLQSRPRPKKAVGIVSPPLSSGSPISPVVRTSTPVTIPSSLPSSPHFGPAPVIHRISPDFGFSAGGQLVVIHGRNFPRGITIEIGGVPCTVTTYISDQQIYCITGAHAPGHVNVEAISGSSRFPMPLSSAAAGNFEYGGPVPPVFGSYWNSGTTGIYPSSEAEVLVREFPRRLSAGAYLHRITNELGNVQDVTNTAPVNVRSYEILANRIQGEAFTIGSVYSENEVISASAVPRVGVHRLTRDQANAIGDELMELVPNVRIVTIANPEYNARVFPLDQIEYIRRLRSQIYDRINQLDSVNGGFFRNMTHSNGNGIRLSIPASAVVHARILDAIRQSNDENNFINAVAEIAAGFSNTHLGARDGFINDYVFLYVTKQYPSKAGCVDGYHFAFQCTMRY